MIVADASVLADALIDPGKRGRQARSRLGAEELAAPAIIDAEVLSTLRKRVNHGSVSLDAAMIAVDALRRMSLRRVVLDGLIARMWELRSNLTPYDAAYVALAEALEIPLMTADKRLAAAPGPRCRIEVFK